MNIMKKINVLIIAVIAFATAFMTSCNPDTSDFAAPTITFGEDTGNQTVIANSDVAIAGDIYAAGEIKQIIYFKDDVSFGDAITSGFDTDTTTHFSMSIPGDQVTETFTFEVQVTDKNDKIGKGSVTITVDVHDTTVVKTTSAIQLYPAPSDHTGVNPRFSSLTPDFSTYSWSTAQGNEATIDIMYYNGRYTKSQSNAPHFVSANVSTQYTHGGDALSGDNTTHFKILEGTELSDLGDWSSINSDVNISTIDMTSAGSNVGELSDGTGAFDIGSIIAFQLSNGKKGLIKVNSLVDGNNNGNYYDPDTDYITFDVIVQNEASTVVK